MHRKKEPQVIQDLAVITLPKVRVAPRERLTMKRLVSFAPSQYGLIQGAAGIKNMSVAEFIRNAAHQAALATIEDWEKEKRK